MRRTIPYAEIEMHGDYTASFIRRRLSDGQEWTQARGFLSRAHFLEALNRWNRQQPSTWSYREA